MKSDEGVEIRGEADFDARVTAASAQRVVVVDFWAPWCAPCLALGPALEKVVRSFGEKAMLVKVNVDENQVLAAKWNIRGIPAVKVFKSGKVVKELVGALPETELRRELSSVIPSESDEIVAEGDRLAGNGDVRAAEASYRKALDVEPGHAGASVRLARMAFEKSDLVEARRLAESVSASANERGDAEGILASIDFAEKCEEAGGRHAAEKQVEMEPGSLDARYGLACCLAAEKRYEEALTHFLAIMEKDRRYREEAAKKAMVRIFAIVGQRSPLADEYRERLVRVLYS
jgi:putative thioredoxin